jgi:Fic family protein
MNVERFQQSPSGGLVPVTHGTERGWAFVPHPLPPPLAFDNGLILQLSDADRALGELAGLGRTLLNPQLLIRPFIRREAVLSSRIEGTQTGLAELYQYEAAQLALPGLEPPASSDAQEVLNYVHALEWGLEQMQYRPVNLGVIRALHAELMTGVRGGRANPGAFRAVQNYIAPSGTPFAQARYVPPPPLQMQDALLAFEQYVQAPYDYPPLVRLALIHYQFEAIHPFEDGNGRTGRLLISLLLGQWNLLPLPLLYLSAYFERHRQDYYDLLLAVSERGEWLAWVRFFLAGVAEQARDAIDRAKRLQDLREGWRTQLTDAQATGFTHALVDVLFKYSPVLTVRLAEQWLNTSYRSAKTNVEKLTARGILRASHRSANGWIYVADDILRLLREETMQ